MSSERPHTLPAHEAPTEWPEAAVDALKSAMESGDPLAVARATLHWSAQLAGSFAVDMDRAGHRLLDAIRDEQVERAVGYIWNLGNGGDHSTTALAIMRGLMATEIKRAIDATNEALLNRLQVRADGTCTIGPPRPEPTAEDLRTKRAAWLLAMLEARGYATLAKAEESFCVSAANRLADGEDIDPATLLTLERLYQKAHPRSRFQSEEGMAAELARIDSATDEMMEADIEPACWAVLEDDERAWLREVKRSKAWRNETSREAQENVWRLHAKAERIVYERQRINDARTALAAWPDGWDNRDLLDPHEIAWLDEKRGESSIDIGVALYALELRAVEAE